MVHDLEFNLTMYSIPVAADFTGEFPTWNLTVTDTAPIWAYVSNYFIGYGNLILIPYSAVNKPRLAIVALEWSCKYAP